jgi:hypothetical protein
MFLICETKEHGPLGSVATIGRQGLDVPPYWLKRLLPSATQSYGRYCEQVLIDCFGASSVESFDNSDYEGATHVHDFNIPVPLDRKYDAVLDAGTTEHIFNAPQALANISALCAEGGRIIHVLPANNYCGHGFWQFSPELFFSLYSEANGYDGTKVFLASLSNWRTWYQCHPTDGHRAEFRSLGRSPLLIMARTVKRHASTVRQVQQSDYVAAWKEATVYRESRIKGIIKNSQIWPLARRIDYLRAAFRRPPPYLTKVPTKILVG